MTKEEFIKELNHNLRYLKKKDREEIISKYNNLETTNLDPIKIANDIYKEKKLTFRITSNISFLEAANNILDALKQKDKRKNVLIFFLKLILIIIIIKIPFIYIRDMSVTIFNNIFISDKNYMILHLIIEFIYALTSIYYLIKQFKKEAYMLKDVD